MPEILTATELRLLAMCERRVWLDKFGDKSQRDDVTGKNFVAFQRGIEHEATVRAATSPNLHIIPVETWRGAVQESQNAIQRRIKTLDNACLEALIKVDGKQEKVLFRGAIDRLERHADGFYYPIEIKKYTQLTEADYLQLDFYCLLLGEIQGKIPNGEFWLSSQANSFPEQKIHHEYNPERLKAALDRWVNLFRFKKPPELIYESHCRKCHWQAFCVSQLKKDHKIESLWKMEKVTRQELKARGIFTLEQFVTLSIDEIRELSGVNRTAFRYKAHAEAWINDAPVRYAGLPSHLLNGGIMFDLETNVRERNLPVWSIGWSNNQERVKIVIVNPEHDTPNYVLDERTDISIVKSPEAAWWFFYDSIKDSDTPIYHWWWYENSTIKRDAPKEIQEALLPRMHDLGQIFIKSVQLPVRHYSMKDVASHFEFQWEVHQSWEQAFWDYGEWKATSSYEALKRAASYQRDDVLSMLTVWRWMVEDQ
jgi:predicted RecB family nuclease